jgi:hypothetical protein
MGQETIAPAEPEASACPANRGYYFPFVYLTGTLDVEGALVMARLRLFSIAFAALLLAGFGGFFAPYTAVAGTAGLTAQVSSHPPVPQIKDPNRSQLAIVNAALAEGARKAHLTPDANGPGSVFCGVNNTKAFMMIWGSTDSCQTSPITINWTDNGTIYYLANSSGARVWFHQNANGTGWAHCFNHGQFYSLQGNDRIPGNVQLTNVASQCTSGNVSTELCNETGPFAGLTTENFGSICYQDVGHHNTDGLEIESMSNGTGGRVWFHQNVNGSGWTYCYSNNNVYWLVGQDPDHAKDLYISSTTAAC